MSATGEQNAFGFFGKLPTRGDFIQQLLPQDFVNSWHEWLQQCMAAARESLAEDFLRYYLNCPAWKFLAFPGVCGAQAVVGLTIPSVDKVGRYFNFTLATMLPMEAQPCGYVMGNRDGMSALEVLALDILEKDYPMEEIELKLRELSLQFNPTLTSKHELDGGGSYLCIMQDQPLPFADQAGGLLEQLVTEKFGNSSIWWCGLEGQTRSQLVVCSGMPSAEVYSRLLTLGDSPAQPANREVDSAQRFVVEV